MLLVLPENMGLVIRSLCPYLPGVFPCPLPSTQSSSCVLRDICVASAWLSRFPYCLGLGLREEVPCPCHVSLGLVARAGFVVKQLENACGARLEVTKRWPLGWARTGQRASCHHLTFRQRRKVSQMSSRGQFKHLILCRLTFLLMDVNCAVPRPSLVFLECSR